MSAHDELTGLNENIIADLMTFRLSVNRSHVGKIPEHATREVWGIYNGKFINETLNIVSLGKTIQQGYAISAELKGYRKREKFKSCQILGLDFDTEDERSTLDTLQDTPFIGAYGAIIHTTSSHKPEKPRARVLFILDQPVTDVDRFAQIATAVVDKYGSTDQNCKDPARLWYGAKDCELRTPNNILPLAVVESELLQPYLKKLEQQRSAAQRRWQTNTTPELEEIADALRCIPAWGEYDQWLKVLMAVHSVYPGPEGIALCEQWSPGKNGEIEYKFRSFNGSGVTKSTIFGIAKGYGYRPEQHIVSSNGRNGTANREPSAEARSEKKTRALSEIYVQKLNEKGYHFRMSDLDDRVQVNGQPISDGVAAEIRAWIRDQNIIDDFYMFEVKAAEDAYTANALQNCYHPVKKFFNQLPPWDGQDHIFRLAEYFKDKNGVFGTYLRRWLVGAVVRLYQYGEQNRVLVMDGPQNIGKSFFVRWLAQHLMAYYLEGRVDPENKDHDLRLIDKFIWEVPELGAVTRRVDREALKYFISKQWVDVRSPYAKYSLHKPAMASFIATVNNENGFLNDPTGSRRFMTCTLSSIDWTYAQTTDVDQLWSQAKALYQQGETGMLTDEEYAEAEIINAEYKTVSAIYDRLEEIIIFEPEGVVLSNDILDELKARGHSGHENWVQQEVAAWMKERGIEQSRRQLDIGGKKQKPRCWLGIKILKRYYDANGRAAVQEFTRNVDQGYGPGTRVDQGFN